MIHASLSHPAPLAPPLLPRLLPRPPVPGCRPGPGAPATPATWEACFALLEGLPSTEAQGVRPLAPARERALCVASLLCRLVDVLDAAPTWDTARKARALRMLRRQLEGGAGLPGWHEAVAHTLRGASAPQELALLRALPLLLGAFESLAPEERPVVARCVQELAVGLAEMQALREQHPEGGRPLPSLAALHRHCHYVAGTWSTLLTELLFLRSPHVDKACYFALTQHAESLAQLLQRVHLLEELPRALAAGRCPVPRDVLQAHGLTASGLLVPARRDVALKALTPLLTALLGFLPGAWRYLTLLPLAEREVRRVLAGHLFLALSTLRRALAEPERLLGQGGALRPDAQEADCTAAWLGELLEAPAGLSAALSGWAEDCGRRALGTWPPEVLRALASCR